MVWVKEVVGNVGEESAMRKDGRGKVRVVW